MFDVELKESAMQPPQRQNVTSAPARHENPEQTDQPAPTGGGSGAAPCSAGDSDIEKLRPIQHEIINELSRAFDRLGAERGVFAALHSWGDTMPESEVLAMLRDQNEISTSTSSTQV